MTIHSTCSTSTFLSFLILDLRDLACKRGSLDTMSDGVPSTGLLASHKARQPRRSSPLPQSGVGRGSDTHVRSKNKTWVSGAARSQTQSPAPEGRWERGGHRGRGRGTHGVNGHVPRLAQSVDASDDERPETKMTDSTHRLRRFEMSTVQHDGSGKTWEEVCVLTLELLPLALAARRPANSS